MLTKDLPRWRPTVDIWQKLEMRSQCLSSRSIENSRGAAGIPSQLIRAARPHRHLAGRSLRIRKLIFRNHSLNLVRLALDAVSKTPIGLNRHMPDDGVNHGLTGCVTSLWALGLVVNVVIQFVGIRHLSTSNSQLL